MDFTIRQLKYFVATAENEQISRAAQICNVSQSSVTIAIRGLEEQIGFDLFVRQSRGVRLTIAGERFLRSSYLILGAVQDAAESISSDPSTIVGTVNVGVSNTISGYLLPPLWYKFGNVYPRIELNVREVSHTELELGLAEEEFDLVLMLTSNVQHCSSYCYEDLMESQRRLWVSRGHPLVEMENVSLKDLENEDYILLTMDDHEAAISKMWTKFDFEPKVTFKCRSIEALRSMVANNMGVSIVSDMVYRSWSLEGRPIARKKLVEDVPSMNAGVVWKRNQKLSKAAETFLTFLRSEMADSSK